MESVIATREEVMRFLSIHGDGCGYGSGSGSGDGSGDGYGCGYGSGDGYGCGYGDGSGSGCGSGCGDGYGCGYGDGYGCGSGDGSGDGDLKTFNGQIVDYIDDLPTIIVQVKGSYARGYTVGEDFILKPCYIARSGWSLAHGDTLKEAFADAQAKELEDMPEEDRIAKFVETFGNLTSEHSGREFYNWHHILTGSCTMGRNDFCKAHGIDMEKQYTVDYFLTITANSYGGSIIRKVREAFNEM